MANVWIDTELNLYHRDASCPDAKTALRFGYLQTEALPDSVARERLLATKCGRCQEMTRKKGLPGDAARR